MADRRACYRERLGRELRNELRAWRLALVIIAAVFLLGVLL